MPVLISVSYAGKATVPINGQSFDLDLIIIQVSENESTPVDYIAYRNIENEGENHEEDAVY